MASVLNPVSDTPPFIAHFDRDPGLTETPNEPFLPVQDQERVFTFLQAELACPALDEKQPRMHLMTTLSSQHTDALHYHLLKGRSIVLTENPALHLVWHHRSLYVKPIPHCLFSRRFWAQHLDDSPGHPAKASLRRAALGFVRSFCLLIRHESDYDIAVQNRLISNRVSYSEFQKYAHGFSAIPDALVSPRWQVGQLRLTRLNWGVRIFALRSRSGRGLLQRLCYHEIYWETRQAVEDWVPATLFLFVATSVILLALQGRRQLLRLKSDRNVAKCHEGEMMKNWVS